MLFEEAMQLFEEYMRLVQKSNKTIKNYMSQLRIFNNYLCRVYNRPSYLDEVAVDDIEKFLFNELGEEKYSASYRDNMVTSFKSLYTFCHSKGHCKVNVGKEVKHIHVCTKERTYLSEIEFRKIMKNVKNNIVRTVLQTLFFTGLRVDEAKNIKLCDVDFERETIFVAKGKGGKERLMPMNQKLKKILLDYFRDIRVDMGTDNFFSTKTGGISTNWIEQVLRETIREMELDKRVTPHVFRHSFASNLLKGKIDLFRVQKLMDHERIETTSIYLHTDMEELERAVNLL